MPRATSAAAPWVWAAARTPRRRGTPGAAGSPIRSGARRGRPRRASSRRRSPPRWGPRRAQRALVGDRLQGPGQVGRRSAGPGAAPATAPRLARGASARRSGRSPPRRRAPRRSPPPAPRRAPDDRSARRVRPRPHRAGHRDRARAGGVDGRRVDVRRRAPRAVEAVQRAVEPQLREGVAAHAVVWRLAHREHRRRRQRRVDRVAAGLQRARPRAWPAGGLWEASPRRRWWEGGTTRGARCGGERRFFSIEGQTLTPTR